MLALLLQNPEIGNDEPPNAGLSNKAEYKGSQQKQFGGYRWIACHDASLLDAERCEFIFIGATEDLQGRATLASVLVHCLPSMQFSVDAFGALQSQCSSLQLTMNLLDTYTMALCYGNFD